MKRSAYLSTVILLVALANQVFAQDFIPAYDRFSGKETSYIMLEDGSKVEGTLEDLDRKKGLIQEVVIKDASGKKITLTPDRIKAMYLMPSGFSKLSTNMDVGTKVKKWDAKYIDSEIIKKGYAYFEKAKVVIKKDQEMLLMQLLNPGFNSKIKVFHDPFAAETMRVGFGGLTMAGGDDKSYYVQVGDNVAKKLKKKDYDDEYKVLYASCSPLLKKISEKLRWTEFAQHIYEFSFDCQ
jgi:transcriptional antiterminator Rof (Rho-off)